MQERRLLILDTPLHTEPLMHVCVRVCESVCVCRCKSLLQERPSNVGREPTPFDTPQHTEPSMNVCVRMCARMCVCAGARLFYKIIGLFCRI